MADIRTGSSVAAASPFLSRRPATIWPARCGLWYAGHDDLMVAGLRLPGHRRDMRRDDGAAGADAETAAGRCVETGRRRGAPVQTIPLSPAALQALLVVAGLGCCLAMSMPQVHIVAYCVDLGFGVARGGEMLSIMWRRAW